MAVNINLIKKDEKELTEEEKLQLKKEKREELKEKVQHFFKMFNYNNFAAESKTYNKEGVTLFSFAAVLFIVLFLAFIVGYLLKLDLVCAVLLVIFAVACVPSMLLARFKFSHEKQRFDDTISYLEQMVYSFRKTNKIRNSLQDVSTLSSGKMKRTILKAIKYIDKGEMKSGNLYEEALAIIEKEYSCTRIEILHNYLVEIEMHGGKSSASLSVLLSDIRSWSLRVLEYQQQRASLRVKVTVSIIMAMTTCGMMLNVIPKENVNMIIGEPVYQVATTIVLLLSIALYVIANNILGGSYLDLEVEGKNEDAIIKKYEYLLNYDKIDKVKPAIIKTFMLLPAIGALIYLDYVWMVVPMVMFSVIMVFQPVLHRNSCQKAVTREINRVFPIWIRSLILRLQVDNVHIALRNSLDTAPAILKPEIMNLLLNIEKEPNSIKPYTDFCKDFDIGSLKMSVHFLYSLAEFGADDMLAQLDYLVEQNNELTINSERIQNEDALAGMSMLILVPMIFSVGKLIVDMYLFFSQFMEYVQGVM